MADGRVYRAIFRGQEGLARSIIDHREVRALMAEGLLARMGVSDRKVGGFNLVVESERAPFDVPCERFTRATLRAAALRWLQVCRRLLPAGLVLSDAHYGNTMLFGANEPRWVDLGSIRQPSAVEPETPFRSFQRFWSGMLAPLVVATGTWVMAERTYRRDPQRLTALMMTAFFGKMAFFGAYVAVMLAVLKLRPIPFVVSFTSYFIGLYLTEALCLRRLFASGTT